MKLYLKQFIFLIILCFSITSSYSQHPIISKVTSQQEINSIKNYASQFKDFSKIYDFQNIEKIKTEENSQVETILIKKLDNNSNNLLNEFLTILIQNGTFQNMYHLETSAPNSSIVHGIYSYIDGDKLFEVEIDSKNQTYSATSLNRINCGQDVMDCITDAYSNQGWSSLALSLVSAVQPEALIIVTALCISKNCKKK